VSALLAATILIPFVSVGTIKFGLRVIVPDWIFLGLGLLVLTRPRLFAHIWTDLTRRTALILGAAFATVACIALALGLGFYSDANLAKLPTHAALVGDIGRPLARGAVDQLRLFQGLAALIAVLVLVRTRVVWRYVAEAVVLAGTLVSIYGAYQVFSQAAFGAVHQPPGAFPYPSLLRASGTFPEPTAYAGFLLFALAVATVVLQMRPRAWVYAAAVVMLLGLVLSRSTVGVAGVAVFVAGLVYIGDKRLLLLVLSALAAGTLLAAAAGGGGSVAEIVRKPFSDQNSVEDRKASWEAAARMGIAYAPLGVGRGQYAYNVAPFLDPTQSNRAGRAQSAVLETWAETGPVGTALLLCLFLIGPFCIIRRGRPDREARALLVLAAVFGVTLLFYYTSTYVWLWLGLALLVTGAQVVAARDRDWNPRRQQRTRDRDEVGGKRRVDSSRTNPSDG
jgi:O-antigen ligase